MPSDDLKHVLGHFWAKIYFDFFTLESDHGWDLEKFSKKSKNHNFEKPHARAQA